MDQNLTILKWVHSLILNGHKTATNPNWEQDERERAERLKKIQQQDEFDTFQDFFLNRFENKSLFPNINQSEYLKELLPTEERNYVELQAAGKPSAASDQMSKSDMKHRLNTFYAEHQGTVMKDYFWTVIQAGHQDRQ